MKKLTKILFLILLLCAIRYPLNAVQAAVPHLINYQGKLTDPSGLPLEGAYQITFRIYDAEAGGSLLWEETQDVTIQKGMFSVMLGASENLDRPFDQPYFLEIKVGDEVMTPRQTIASAGYAIRAEQADTSGGVVGSENVFPSSGNVGVGTTAPAAKLEVQGGAIKATGGLIIETRTSDPAEPVTGQIWLRSDL